MGECPFCCGIIHEANPRDHLKRCPAIAANSGSAESSPSSPATLGPADKGTGSPQGDFTFGYIMGAVYALGALVALGQVFQAATTGNGVGALVAFLLLFGAGTCNLFRSTQAVPWSWVLTGVFALAVLANGLVPLQIGVVALMAIHSYWLQKNARLLREW